MIFELFAIFAIGALLIFLANPKTPKGTPAGPRPFPVVGNIPQLVMANAKFPHRGMEKIAAKYGELMSFWFGSHYMVVLSSFEIMKDLLSRPEGYYGRFVFPFVPDRAYGKVEMGIIFNQGEAWQELKRFTIKALKDFGFGKRQTMDGIMREEVEEFMAAMRKNTDANGVWKVDPHTMACSAVNIMWSLVAGYRFHLEDERLMEAVKHHDSIIQAVGPTNVYSFFPWVKTWFPKFSRFEEHMATYVAMQDFLDDVVGEIKKNRRSAEPQNFIEVYLDEIEKTGGKNPNYTAENLNVILQDLFLAGSETTSNSLAWTILYLAVHSEVQRKLYAEVVSVAGKNGVVNLDMEPSLLYTKAVILESFRWANVVPMPGPRVAMGPITVGNYTIPKGTGLMFNLEPVFRDKKFWGDPENFRPERFLQKKADGTQQIINADRIAVFGFGRRLCLGESIAWKTLILFTATLVKTFEFSVIPGMEPRLEDAVVGGSLSPVPTWLKLTPRA